MFAHLGRQVVADDDDFLCLVRHKNANQAVDQVFAVNLHERFRDIDSLLCEPRTLACGYDGVFHLIFSFKWVAKLVKISEKWVKITVVFVFFNANRFTRFEIFVTFAS